MGNFRGVFLIHVEEVTHCGCHGLLTRVVGCHGHKAAKDFEPTAVPEFNNVVVRCEAHATCCISCSIRPATRELVAALLAYPDGQSLSYFSMITMAAAPRTIATQELRMESMFPSDNATQTRHVALMRYADGVKAPSMSRSLRSHNI